MNRNCTGMAFLLDLPCFLQSSTSATGSPRPIHTGHWYRGEHGAGGGKRPGELASVNTMEERKVHTVQQFFTPDKPTIG